MTKALKTAPKTLNGFPVLHRMDHYNGYWTVYLQRAEDDHVVATWWSALADKWSWGHYHRDEKDALEDYADTCKRNADRGTV